MKVRVRAFLTMKEVLGGQSSFEVELETTTLSSLLEILSEQYGEPFIDRVFEPGERRLSRGVLLLINGRNHTNLPQGIDTILEDGDEVAFFPPMAGG